MPKKLEHRTDLDVAFASWEKQKKKGASVENQNKDRYMKGLLQLSHNVTNYELALRKYAPNGLHLGLIYMKDSDMPGTIEEFFLAGEKDMQTGNQKKYVVFIDSENARGSSRFVLDLYRNNERIRGVELVTTYNFAELRGSTERSFSDAGAILFGLANESNLDERALYVAQRFFGFVKQATIASLRDRSAQLHK